jgi:hypothetical protein
MFKGRRNSVTIFLLLTIAMINAHSHESKTDQPAVAQLATGPADSLKDSAPVRPIGIIDFYGLHQLTAEQLRKQLTFKVGDSVALGDLSFFAPSKQRLMMVQGVSRAHVQVVCCTDDRPVVFVGIEEKNASTIKFRRAPTGAVRLPPEMLQTGVDFDALRMKAVLANEDEDDSEGHTLLRDASARPTEDRFIAIANNDLGLLRKVLRDSADSEHRALAAQLLGYAKDLQSVVPDLVYAMSDSSEVVRNNAMRALVVFTMATKVKPPRVPYRPFIALLNSPIWTDRNKSSIAIMQMASTRDPKLLTVLRDQALPSLVEMARWGDRGHAYPAFSTLGNLAGLDDKVVSDDFWGRNDREPVIAAALSRR